MISIIVPIYNIEDYLPKCIESILEQTYTDIEIILVNDGSTDNSLQICKEYEQKDNRIVLINKPNGGLVSARKAGIRAAKGKYIAYVDGDDWVEPDMYEKMYRILIEENVDVVMCGRLEETGKASKAVLHGFSSGRYSKEYLIKEIYPSMIAGEQFYEWGIFPSVWDKLFLKESIEKYQLAVDERIMMGEDAVCVYPALLNVNSIYILGECLYHYRQSNSSMIKKVQDYEKECEQFRILYKFEKGVFDENKKNFDVQEQWLRYVSFLMIPRADGLYKDFEKKDFLFPFKGVKKGSNIVLYGAGTYGQRLYGFLTKTNFCNVVAWVDRNYIEFQKMGLSVETPEVLDLLDYDGILIANIYANSRENLYQELISKYQSDKIHKIDVQLVLTEETKSAFGLAK